MADWPTGYHDDAELFRDALRFTAAETSFSERLIEKDYFCSVALADLAAAQLSLAFKGGTCLSKVHGSFYRLSEDLDIGISTAMGESRSERGPRRKCSLTHRLTSPGRGCCERGSSGGARADPLAP